MHACEWLSEESLKWYPKLIEEFKKLNINPRAIKLMEEGTRLYEKGEEDRKQMLKNGWIDASEIPEEIAKAHGWLNCKGLIHPRDFTEAERQKYGFNKDGTRTTEKGET